MNIDGFMHAVVLGTAAQDAEEDRSNRGEGRKVKVPIEVFRPRSGREPAKDRLTVVAYGERADWLLDHVRQGTVFLVEGRLQIHNYQRDGQWQKAVTLNARHLAPYGGGEAPRERRDERREHRSDERPAERDRGYAHGGGRPDPRGDYGSRDRRPERCEDDRRGRR